MLGEPGILIVVCGMKIPSESYTSTTKLFPTGILSVQLTINEFLPALNVSLKPVKKK